MLLKGQPPISLCLSLGSWDRISNTKTMSDLGSLGFFVSLDVFLNRGTQIRSHDLMEASQYNLFITSTNTIQILLEFTIASYPANFMTSVLFIMIFFLDWLFPLLFLLMWNWFLQLKNVIKMAKSTKRILEQQLYTLHCRWFLNTVLRTT